MIPFLVKHPSESENGNDGKNTLSSSEKRIIFFVSFAIIVLLLMAGSVRVVYDRVCEYTVTFITAEGTETKTVYSTHLTQMPEVVPPEGESFIGWTDELGNAENRTQIRITKDSVYTAHYITALNTTDHIPYLTADEDGLYWPQHIMTRSDAAIAINALLCKQTETTDSFQDVSKDMECFNAANQLKALGIVEGSQFSPDEGITLTELIHWLAAFVQPTEQTYSFSFIGVKEYGYQDYCTAAALGWIDPEADMNPDAILTRLDAVKMINRATGRTKDSSVTLKETGYLADCGPFDENYLEFAEATVEHSFTRNEDGTESWTDSKPAEKLYSGYVMVQGKLRYADEDGLFVRGYNEDNLFFDDDGNYTSGSAELDDIVWSILGEITDDSMTREEKLHAAYDYVVHNFTYLARPHHGFNSTGWEIQEATWMFKNGKGNCYCFAAAFWALARGLGYDAQCQAGLCAPGLDHGWVNIEEDGVWYIYDTEIEYTSFTSRWKLDRSKYCSWRYSPDPQLTYGTETPGNAELYSDKYNYSEYDPNNLPDDDDDTLSAEASPENTENNNDNTENSGSTSGDSGDTGGTSENDADSGNAGNDQNQTDTSSETADTATEETAQNETEKAEA